MRPLRVLLIFSLLTFTTAIPYSSAQLAGELLAIDYPQQVKKGEDFTVTMEVENTGNGIWDSVCAFVGYRIVDGDEKVTDVHTCDSLEILEPGEVGVYSCTAKIEPLGVVNRVWAGVGAPFG